MTARRVKHAKALEKREAFMKTVHEGNYDVLSKVRSQRENEEKKAQEELKAKKMEKSRQLARKNNATPKKNPPVDFKMRKRANHDQMMNPGLAT